jgi:beta-glucanase (GH16 family)
LEGLNTYNKGLIIADILHMPENACGAWPSFWTLGPSWPNQGEIDIIEGVNFMTNNQATLHTSGEYDTCTIIPASENGTTTSTWCDVGRSFSSFETTLTQTG